MNPIDNMADCRSGQDIIVVGQAASEGRDQFSDRLAFILCVFAIRVTACSR